MIIIINNNNNYDNNHRAISKDGLFVQTWKMTTVRAPSSFSDYSF